MEKLWTTAEVAQFLGISEPEVETLVRDGRLTGYKLGGKFLRFQPEQVTALKQQVAPAQPRSATATTRPSGLSWRARFREAVYFYDLYLLAGVLLIGVFVYLIVAG